MLQQDSDQKTYRKVVASPGLEVKLRQPNDPLEGVRLIRAFLQITDPGLRSVILHIIETMGSTQVEC
jgi:hypothetical protein